jgi:hypothetical protein
MESQAILPFDISARKHQGNKNSRAANLKLIPHKSGIRARIVAQVAAMDYQGLTVNEIKIWDDVKARYKPINEFSGRVTEAKALGELFDSGRNRDGCAVLVARKEFVKGGSDAGLLR